MNSMSMTFCSFDMNWEIAMNLKHDILVWTFENVDMKHEDHCIDNVI